MKIVKVLLFGAVVFCSLTACTNKSPEKENKCIEEIENKEVVEAVNAVKEILPAKMWDGLVLDNVIFHTETKEVELVIYNFYNKGMTTLKNADKTGLNKYGMFIVENFMKGYSRVKDGTDGEGDDDLYKTIIPMLECLVNNDINLSFDLEDRKLNKFKFKIAPKYIKRTIHRI